MRILITGCGGFLGAAVARVAVDAGHEVIATARQPAPQRLAALAGKLRVRQLDVADAAAVGDVLHHERPDAVIHAAWSGLGGAARDDRAQLAQVESCCRLLEAAAAAGAAKFVGIGSQGEYGRTDRRIGEDDLPRPTSLYGASKLAAAVLGTQLAAQAGIGFAWLRLFATYGPGDNPNWLIPSLIHQMLRGQRPRTTPGTQRWDYLYIDDAAQGALAAAVSRQANGVFNLSSGRGVPVRTIVEAIRDLAAPGMELVFGEIPFGPAQIMHMEGANERLIAATGWTPRIDEQEGLARTVAAARAA